ncbi:Ig-like domain-containing protein [Algibacillus agarilyticus]|uniref:Ig-like domain-containing protein n=1 Tax=Algibacillus agarilyticus TaxID=2234133 RepID=UPI000DCF68BA|nr:Ig-like domain-containing protein [Algibacillus agarilyticus]
MSKIKLRYLIPLFLSQPVLSQQVLSQQANAAEPDYPFVLPENISASIDVKTDQQHVFNNLQLGTNISKFIKDSEQKLINHFDPITIRFPHGLPSNWYDWKVDYARVYGTETVPFRNTSGGISNRKIDHLDVIKKFESMQHKEGIGGLAKLNTEKKTQLGRGYDMLWTFNMSEDGEDGSKPESDGSSSSVARYHAMVERGFKVDFIELGNENFYPGQRSSIIPNTEDYIARAKSMSTALRALNPNIQLSVPMLRRANTANPNWNADLAEDKSYFDAMTVHTYVGKNPDDSTTSDEAYSTALAARKYLAASVNDYSLKVAPNKPIWLTEWGINSGGANAVSALGMADAYIYLSENQQTFQRANWFTVNGKLNSFLAHDLTITDSGSKKEVLVTPLQKSVFGASHEIIRSVFEDSVLLGKTVASPELEVGVKAINAQAVIKNNKVTLFVVNLTNKAAPFTINLDGNIYSDNLVHKALTFDSLAQVRRFDYNSTAETTLQTIQETAGDITLPKYSINRIVLSATDIKPDVFEVNLATKSEQYRITKNDAVTLYSVFEHNADDIELVTFFANNNEIGKATTAPFQQAWTATTVGMNELKVIAKRKDGKQAVTAKKIYVDSDQATVINASLAVTATEIELGQSVSLSATASINVGSISTVNFRVDGVSVHQAATAPFTYNWTATNLGSYSIDIEVIADDGIKQISTAQTVTVSAVPVVIDISLAEITMTEIEVGQSVPLSAEASVDRGRITKVNFMVDGTNVNQDSTAPYGFNWVPTAAGTYTLDVEATAADQSKKVSSSQTVIVKAAVAVEPEKPATPDDNSGGGTGYFVLLLLGLMGFYRKR